MKQLIDYDPVTRKRTIFHSQGGEHFLETQMDVQDIVDLNKAQYNATDERERFGDMALVARIPLYLYFDLMKKGIVNNNGDVKNEADFLKWLDDPANLAWRTRPGRLS